MVWRVVTSVAVGVSVAVLVVWLDLQHPRWTRGEWRARPLPPAPCELDDEGLAPESLADLPRAYAERVSAQELGAAMAVIDPHRAFEGVIRVSSSRAELRDATNDQTVAEVALRDPNAPPDPPLAPQNTWQGLRILLDPGHFGGAFAAAEDRYLVLDHGPLVREGDLNWGVAQLLARRLRARGAEVVVSRDAPPTRAFPVLDQTTAASVLRDEQSLQGWLETEVGSLSTVTWLSGQPHQRTRLRAALAATVWAQNAAEDHSAFAAFNRFDYRRRGLMSGEIAADLMLSLHHNMCKYTYLNRVAAFIPGAVTPSEAKQAGFAFFAFRRALEGDLPLLTELARSIAQHMQDELGVSAHQRPGKPDSPRLDIDAAGGVFARNLAVLRRATGPVVLIEGPCMNHPAEYRRLTRQELTIDGLPLPDRVREYAAAVDAALQPHVAALWQQRARRRQSEVAFGKTTTSTGR